MSTLVSYETDGTTATVTMDDGKVNVLSLAMVRELNAALDRAAAERQVVLLTGREGVFSAGFDLAVAMVVFLLLSPGPRPRSTPASSTGRSAPPICTPPPGTPRRGWPSSTWPPTPPASCAPGSRRCGRCVKPSTPTPPTSAGGRWLPRLRNVVPIPLSGAAPQAEDPGAT
jgi:Enoyl-CoA hydratase/isomerase